MHISIGHFLVEATKMQVRSLNYHSPPEINGKTELSDVSCPSCGSDFELLGEDLLSTHKARRGPLGTSSLQMLGNMRVGVTIKDYSTDSS